MLKGGYKILNFKNYALTSGSGASIEGLYAAVTNPYNKATIISGLVVGDVSYPDFFAPFIASDNSYETSVVISGSTISIVIDEDDNVTVTVTEE